MKVEEWFRSSDGMYVLTCNFSLNDTDMTAIFSEKTKEECRKTFREEIGDDICDVLEFDPSKLMH